MFTVQVLFFLDIIGQKETVRKQNDKHQAKKGKEPAKDVLAAR
jgi:hypothetical protein